MFDANELVPTNPGVCTFIVLISVLTMQVRVSEATGYLSAKMLTESGLRCLQSPV